MSKLVPLSTTIPSVLQDYLPYTAGSSSTTPNSSPSHSPSRSSPGRKHSPSRHSSRRTSKPGRGLPFVTLTYATSLDSRISAAPGVQTIISHPETKTMTHYLRYHHDAILVGVGTILADDPGLNCRWTPASDAIATASAASKSSANGKSSPNGRHSPISSAPTVITPEIASRDPSQIHLIQPIVVDPSFKWDPRNSRLLRTAEDGTGLAPYLIVRLESLDQIINDPDTRDRILALEEAGGKIITIAGAKAQSSESETCSSEYAPLSWDAIFRAIYKETTGTGVPIRSVMVEGGATVINSLLDEASSNVESKGPPPLVSSVVVTVGPVFLGSRGVSVSPVTSQPRLNHVRWWTGSRDAVVCGRIL